MRRFFFDPDERQGDVVILPQAESRHLTKVLRLTIGDSVELLDGQGNLFSATVTTTGKSAQLTINTILESSQSDSRYLKVYQGQLKGEKMDMVVQKCTELGVSSFQPYHSTRCQGKLQNTVVEKKRSRWTRISLEACKQCRRILPMTVEPADQYNELLASKNNTTSGVELRLLFWEEEKQIHLKDIAGISAAKGVEILLGPEGGLTGDEVELARSMGWQTVSLGKRILRAETATLTAVSILQYLRSEI